MRTTGGMLEVGLRNVRNSAELAALHPELTYDDYVVIRVRDTGPGIDAAT